MFCFKCGSQLNDDAVFCHKCGTKVNSVVQNNPISMQKLDNGELNRDALRIYLGDVLALECAKKKYLAKLQKFSNNITYYQKNNLYKIDQLFGEYRAQSASSTCIHLFYNGKNFYIANVSAEHFEHGVYTNDRLLGSNWKWIDVEANMDYLTKTYSWRQTTYPFTGRFKEVARRTKARDSFLRIYSEFKKTAPVQYQKNLCQLNYNIKAIDGIKSELARLEEILEKAYSINIIPGAFRKNIYAIYYLYDFIKTSNESLATALLHFDLNEIKSKLDIIIEQQQEIIIQQATLVAQNQQMINQNRMTLEQLSRIESNTARAAQYAEIASNNAEACAWVGIANYLKD